MSLKYLQCCYWILVWICKVKAFLTGIKCWVDRVCYFLEKKKKLSSYVREVRRLLKARKKVLDSHNNRVLRVLTANYLITSGHSGLMSLAGIEYQESRRNQESFFWSTYFWMELYNRFIIPLGKIVLFVWVWYLPCLPNFLEPCAKDFVQTQSE